MGLIKLFILLALVLAALALWRRYKAWQPARGSAADQASPETMVRCAHCQVHLPQSQALQDSERRWFCSREHHDGHGRG